MRIIATVSTYCHLFVCMQFMVRKIVMIPKLIAYPKLTVSSTKLTTGIILKLSFKWTTGVEASVMWARACWIDTVNRIIQAIGKHVIAQNALAGGDEGVCADEAAEGGVVVAGLEVVKPRFLVVDIASIAEGVVGAEGGGQGAGGG